MPKVIALFERLAYFAVGLQILSLGVRWFINFHGFQSRFGFDAEIKVIEAALELFLIWKITQKRKNWARLIWIAAMCGESALGIYGLMLFPNVSMSVLWAIAAATYLVSLASAFTLLTSGAKDWFRPEYFSK